MKNVLGELMEINIIGNEDTKKYLFKCSEVMKILNDTFNYRKYKKGTEYTYVIVEGKKELYLTYKGILRVLFASNSTIAESFQDWATEKLFTIQMGTVEAKQELAANILGTDPKAIKEAFSTCDAKTPCIYLLNIGSAKDLLKDDKYSSDSLLCKYGRSDDFSRRLSEHENNFKKEFNTNISVLYFSVIDPKFISQAESDVASFVSPFKVNFKDTKELIVIEKNNLKMFKKMFTTVQDSYIGCYKELDEKVKRLERENIDLKNELEIKLSNEKHKHQIELSNEKHKYDMLEQQHVVELKNKDIELMNKDIELKNKDISVLEMKVKFYEMNSK